MPTLQTLAPNKLLNRQSIDYLPLFGPLRGVMKMLLLGGMEFPAHFPARDPMRGGTVMNQQLAYDAIFFVSKATEASCIVIAD